MNKFPENFLWGGAISSSQAEGGFDKDGRLPSIYDYMPVGKQRYDWYQNDIYKAKDAYYPNRNGINFYESYKEDIKLMAEMGCKAFRLSISWSRIYPTGEEEVPNEKGIQYYEHVIDELLHYNIEPVVTILHYDIPEYLVSKYNGFASRKLVDLYVKYAVTLFKRFGHKVKYWMTFNEINIVQYCPLDAGIKNLGNHGKQMMYQASHHMFLASALAVAEYKKMKFDGQIGMMLGYEPMYPRTCDPKDILLADITENELLFYSDVQVFGYYPKYMLNYFERNGISIEKNEEDDAILMNGKVDYIAISYYSSAACSSDPNEPKQRGNIAYTVKNPYLKATQWGWQMDSIGMQTSLIRIYNRYRKPIFVVECGIGVKEKMDNQMIEDDYRIDFLQKHILEVRHAIEYGVDVLGFLSWSPIDMPSAATGELEKRYGFVYVDADNYGNGSYKRSKKKSFAWYKKVMETNGDCLEE